MAIKMVREPSDSPNITNLDDFVGLRYSYGDQDGYCVGKGSEVDHSVSGSTFKVLSGRVVVQGVECDIDANGVDIIIDSVATKRYHTVYAQVSLATMTSTVLESYDTAGYPAVNKGDDLNENTIGTARTPLYTFISQNGVISSVTKVIQPIQYAYQQVASLKTGLQNGTVAVKIAQYASQDTSKGTIESRLTRLGFKSGSTSIPYGTAYLKRQGNYVILNLLISYSRIWETSSPLYTGGTLCTLPEAFRPSQAFSTDIGGEAVQSSKLERCWYKATLNFYPSGVVSITKPTSARTVLDAFAEIPCRIVTLQAQLGFEAPAIV